MLARLGIFTFVLMPAVSHAGTFTREALTVDEGNSSALLAATSQRYVDAMQRILDARWKEVYSARRWETLESTMSGMPVARLEYRGADGMVTRVYHAMGGAPLGSLASELFTGESRPSTPDSMDGHDMDDPSPAERAAKLDEYVLQDAEDGALFSPDDVLNVRARLRPLSASRFHPYMVDGTDGALDAEFKALAALESDMQSGAVAQGGKATLLLSGETCNSCEYAFSAATRNYAVELHVVRMVPSLSPAEGKRLVADGKARFKGTRLVEPASGRPLLAADMLDSMREAQVRQTLAPAAMKRRFANIPWEPRTFRLAEPEETPRSPTTDADASPPGC